MSIKSQHKKKEWDVHDYDHRLNLITKNAKRDLSKRNFTVFLNYDKSMVRIPLSKATRVKHLQTILTETKMINKEWKDVLRADIDELVFKIMDTYSDEKGQESNTSYDMKKILRIFYRWMKTGDRKKKQNEMDPYEVQGITLSTVKDKIVREDLLDDDDLDKLLKACGENERDRAFIDVHTEAGTRPGETLSLRIKDVKIDEYGAIINVIGKTYARPVRLIRSVPNLLVYLQNHPFKNEPDAPLWIMIDPDDYGKPMTYYATRAMILRRVKNAKMSKRVYLNLFRHSEATKTANFMTEAQMRKRHGWTATSKMPARYVHMINSDVENAIFEHYGIRKKEDSKPDAPIKCQFCDMFNPHDSDICTKCTKPLSIESAMKIDEEKQEEKILLEEKLKDANNTKAELDQKIQEINKIKDDFVMEMAVKKRDEIFAQRQEEMMNDMQKQIDHL